MLRIYFMFETSQWDMGISELTLQWSQANAQRPQVRVPLQGVAVTCCCDTQYDVTPPLWGCCSHLSDGGLSGPFLSAVSVLSSLIRKKLRVRKGERGGRQG